MAVAQLPVAAPPASGAYLTDGVRLAQMCGVDGKGMFMLEDCGRAMDDVVVIVVSPKDFLSGDWMLVQEFERRKRAAA